MVNDGIKIINIKNIKKQPKDKTYKLIKNALDEKKMGSIVIEVNDYNENELICNVSDTNDLNHKDLEEDMQPVLNQKKINLLELWHFDFDMFYVKKRDRIVVSEKRKKDIEEFEAYCKEHNIDIDDLLYTILTVDGLK
jgi:hypothetical protein